MSRKDFKLSDEHLNAFVDDQLTTEEKSEVYENIKDDQQVNRQICEIRKVRDMVRLAYSNPPLPETGLSSMEAASTRPLRIAACIAAGISLVFGIFMGANISSDISSEKNRQVVAQDDTGSQQEDSATGSSSDKRVAGLEQVKILIHLNSGDLTHVSEALNEVESTLNYYNSIGQRARVELVTNGEGLNIVRKDISPFVERIKRMQREHDNLTFVACQNSINRLKDEQGVTAQLIPGVVVIDSGVAQLMRRQHQGWAYIQV